MLCEDILNGECAIAIALFFRFIEEQTDNCITGLPYHKALPTLH